MIINILDEKVGAPAGEYDVWGEDQTETLLFLKPKSKKSCRETLLYINKINLQSLKDRGMIKVD
ncbi:MAG TPA: hypothetical protein P5232_02700 [Candidatus Moranbacteria bacterium]|nr:hypothetical protein [Candidatus Moranbacteria bacterium]